MPAQQCTGRGQQVDRRGEEVTLQDLAKPAPACMGPEKSGHRGEIDADQRAVHGLARTAEFSAERPIITGARRKMLSIAANR
jgi:hypothetical protein